MRAALSQPLPSSRIPPALADFRTPPGEPALVAPESVSWRVFKNPISLFVGGIAAVVLELAEPRVRSGVWDHTSFRRDPLPRLRRTGLAAMTTVYGAKSRAERMIAGVTRLHARVQGETPDGVAYSALDPELMDWVHATASFGFLHAHHRLVRALSREQRDDFYAEGLAAAALYGAPGAPGGEGDREVLSDAMLPQLEPSPIVFEFLGLMRRTPSLPAALRPLQGGLIRAGVELVPAALRERLGLAAPRFAPRRGERRAVRLAARVADRIPIPFSPPVEACRRLGLPARFLYARS